MLASRSPQRRAILEQLGVQFTIRAPEGVEELEAGPPHEVALENAYRKAAAIAGAAAEGPVLGVDTVVALGARMYGKPADPEEARGHAHRPGRPAPRGRERHVPDRGRPIALHSGSGAG